VNGEERGRAGCERTVGIQMLCLSPPKCVLSLVKHGGHTDKWVVAKETFIRWQSLAVRLREAILSKTDHMVEGL